MESPKEQHQIEHARINEIRRIHQSYIDLFNRPEDPDLISVEDCQKDQEIIKVCQREALKELALNYYYGAPGSVLNRYLFILSHTGDLRLHVRMIIEFKEREN